MRLLSLALFSVPFVWSQNHCDDAYGSMCPEETGWGVGDCLKKVDQTTLSTECVSFINLHDTCKVMSELSLSLSHTPSFGSFPIFSLSIDLWIDFRMISIHIAQEKSTQVCSLPW